MDNKTILLEVMGWFFQDAAYLDQQTAVRSVPLYGVWWLVLCNNEMIHCDSLPEAVK